MFALSTLMNQRGVCAVMRAHAPNPADVPFHAHQVAQAVKAFDGISFEKRPCVKQILVLVFANPRYGDRADCGQTAAAIRAALGQEGPKFATPRLRIPVVVSEVEDGEPYSSMLNYGIYMSGRFGCDYTLILAPEAHAYITEGNLGAVYKACCHGAQAAGLVLGGYEKVLLESGGVTNGFAAWKNAGNVTVHGFDRFSAMPLRASDGSEIIEGGAEEWLPLRWLAEEYGPCIAPIMPVDAASYQLPDPVTQPHLWTRRDAVMRTKLARRDAALAHVHATPDDLIRGVMPNYRCNLMH